MNYNKAEFLASYGLLSQLPASEAPEIAFSGRSNVGKSSLINKIFNRKSLARVSAVPGKTITINFYGLEALFMVDLPGYGYAKASQSEQRRWSELINGYFAMDRKLVMVFQLIDFRHPPTADDLLMLDFLRQKAIPFTVILTKADKLKPLERAARREAFRTELPAGGYAVVEFSAKTGEGVEAVRDIIEALV